MLNRVMLTVCAVGVSFGMLWLVRVGTDRVVGK